MKAEEELRQMAIAHDLFCELNPKSKDTAISILRRREKKPKTDDK